MTGLCNTMLLGCGMTLALLFHAVRPVPTIARLRRQ
jgi:hypothetical protein